MCGIAGIVGDISPEDIAVITAMTDIQSHRGPDSGAVMSLPGALLGHRRLSIIDLSDRANQPMLSPSRRHALVFNGEIYNYSELREELRSYWEFRTDSDTEVLLAAYVHWGDAALDRLNGMFAFAVYDQVERTVFIARDRFGQKPLNFTIHNEKFLFGSEIKALLAAGVGSKPDMATWHRYLAMARYDDDQHTFFSEIEQLRPGECASFSIRDGLRRRRWYSLAKHVVSTDMSYADAATAVRGVMVDAGRIHMRSDVSVGISLSGGLDSSALLAAIDQAGELKPNLGCISVEFGSAYSEREWMTEAATHHGLTSRMLDFSPAEFLDYLSPMIWHLEGPIGGLMNCALTKVLKSARENGTIVMLDGTGIDEAFGGYRNLHDLYLGLKLTEKSNDATQTLQEYMNHWGADEASARDAGRRALGGGPIAIDGSIPVRPDLIDKGLAAAYSTASEGALEFADPMRAASISFLEESKVPRNTRMKDRSSMAFGVELRLPFLDHRLIELALSLPPAYFFRGGLSKSIVREAFSGIMDDKVRIGAKRSVHAPQGQWLKEEPMRRFIHDLIGSRSFGERGLFDAGKVKDAFAGFCAIPHDNSFFVWQWINAELWFRQFIDGDATKKQSRFAVDLPVQPTVAAA